MFELRETLMGKYGEDSKLIYDLADQVWPGGGEGACMLVYDTRGIMLRGSFVDSRCGTSGHHADAACC